MGDKQMVEYITNQSMEVWHIAKETHNFMIYSFCGKGWWHTQLVGTAARSSVAALCAECSFRYEHQDLPSEYEMLRDEVDKHLEPFLHDDDVAEVAIYMEGVEKAGKFVQRTIALYHEKLKDNPACCYFCGFVSISDPNWDHAETCPMLLVAAYMEEQGEAGTA